MKHTVVIVKGSKPVKLKKAKRSLQSCLITKVVKKGKLTKKQASKLVGKRGTASCTKGKEEFLFPVGKKTEARASTFTNRGNTTINIDRIFKADTLGFKIKK